MAGHTRASDFPVTAGAYDVTHNSPNLIVDAFVARLSSDVSTLLASTFLGGSIGEEVADLRLDEDDQPIVCGRSASPDFPVTPGAFNDAPVLTDIFIARLNAELSQLLFASYLEGGEVRALDLTAEPGRIAICGRAYGALPVTDGAFDETFNGGGWDAFAMQLTLGPGVKLLDSPVAGTSVRLGVYEVPTVLQGHVAQVLLSRSGTSPLPLPGGESLRLTPDACTQLSLAVGPILRGTVDSAGEAVLAPLSIPTGREGTVVHAAAFTWDMASGNVSSTTPTISFTIR